MFRFPKLLLVGFILAGSSIAAHAASPQGNDAEIISQAGIPLSKAVSVAVQHSGGKATRAEFEQTRQGPAFDVEVVKGHQTYDARVDAQTGKLISYAADEQDNDDAADAVD